MLRCVALVIRDVSEDRSAPFIRVTRIGELGTTIAVISNRRALGVGCRSVYQRHLRITLRCIIRVEF
jgi:hypothetical protein